MLLARLEGEANKGIGTEAQSFELGHPYRFDSYTYAGRIGAAHGKGTEQVKLYEAGHRGNTLTLQTTFSTAEC